MDDKQSSELFRSLGRIEALVGEQGLSIRKNSEILERNTITVEEHKKMSLNLQKRMDTLESDMAPIKNHVTGIQWVLGALKWTGVVFGAILGGIGLWQILK